MIPFGLTTPSWGVSQMPRPSMSAEIRAAIDALEASLRRGRNSLNIRQTKVLNNQKLASCCWVPTMTITQVLHSALMTTAIGS